MMKQFTFSVIGVPIDCLAFEGPLQAVERMPESLRRAGIVEALGVEDLGDLNVRIKTRARDPNTGVIGLDDCRSVVTELRSVTRHRLASGIRPLFIGGCCTMAVGISAGMRDHFGSAGLVYVDGHLDLYDGATSWDGQLADMPLAIVLGRGPANAFREAMGENPVEPTNTFLVGYRDRAEAEGRNSLMPEDIGPELNHYDLACVRRVGFQKMGETIARKIAEREIPFYMHLDLDVLDESELPATMYHLPKGMTWSELAALLAPLASAESLMAVSIGCYDPDMDPGERLAPEIAKQLGRIFGRS